MKLKDPKILELVQNRTEWVAVTKRNGFANGIADLLAHQYSQKTHFIFELLQNAEDAEANRGTFSLRDSELVFAHNGAKQFTPENIESITSIGRSTKDFTKIGKHGIGFKAVFAYTHSPKIHSGESHFEIVDVVVPRRLTKEFSPSDLPKNETRIILPFDSDDIPENQRFRPLVPSEEAKLSIGNALQDLSPRCLLFLKNIQRIDWSIDSEKQGVLSCSRQSIATEHVNGEMVALQFNGDQYEEWTVFSREVAVDDDGEKFTGQVQVAFLIGEQRVVGAKDTQLVVYFPTAKESNLGFLINGPFKTTKARDNISECAANCTLRDAAADLAADSLEALRELGLLDTVSYRALPIVSEHFPEKSFFHPFFSIIREALKMRSLLPSFCLDSEGDNEFICGNQAVAASDPELRELLTNDELKEALGGDTDWRWLAEDMSLGGDGALAVYLRDEIEIQEFTAEDFVSWLETKDADWWKYLDEPCLLSAYRYLHSQPAEHKRLRKLPLVRLESGEHVSPNEQAVFFPPDNTHERKELEPFLSQLPIIRPTLLADDVNKTVESFLLKIGVARLVASEFIKHYFIPRYQGSNDTTVEEDLALGRYLFRAFQRMSEDERDEATQKLSQIEWLLCRKASQPDTLFLEKSGNAYLGQPYTQSSDLEDYFSASPETCFVHEDYHETGEDWLTFLGELGCSDIPRRSSDMHSMEGLDKALAALRAKTEASDRIRLVNSIVSVIALHVPEREWERDSCFLIRETIWGPRGGNHGSRNVDAKFWITLKQASWLPDSTGNLRKPNALFEDNQQNRRLLGDSASYLHTEIVLGSEGAKWLAMKMGIRFTPNKEAVLSCLKKLPEKDAALADVLPLYEFLSRTAGADDGDVFEGEKLIFCPDSVQKWRPPSEVFWSDESSVFGSTRAYLKSHYPSLQDFFSKVGVQTNANPADYAEALLEIAESSAADEASRHRIHRIYKRLSLLFDEGGDWQEDDDWSEAWEKLRSGQFWLGREGEDFGFYPLGEIVVVDNEHLENLFHGKVAFWPFKDLNDFAKDHLEIATCSAAEQKFEVANEGEKQDALSKRLATAWPFIGDFLQSDRWRGDVLEGRKFTDTPPLIRAAGKIAVIYSLKKAKAKEPDGKAAFFASEANTIWLVPNEASDGEENFEAVSEALQEHYGPEALREFIHDLFRKGIEKTEVKWRKRGLMARLDVSPESEAAEPVSNTSVENSKAAGAPTTTAHRSEGDADKSDETTTSSGRVPLSDNHINHPPTDTKRVEPVPFSDKLKDALNKPGKTSESPQAPERAAVSNPERRREQTEKEIAAAREKEPRQSERQKTLPRTVWESKNTEVRSKLKEWYGGSCQICSETFRKRDGENYFEACYLVPRTAEGAAWLDRVGNVLCLCADCSAKFQFGSKESPPDIQKKIADLKLVNEGGVQPHAVSISLCGVNVAITFDERHLIDLQAMLKADQAGIASARPTGSTHRTESPIHHLVQCPHCPSEVRSDRLDKHIRNVHGQQRHMVRSNTQASAQSRRCKRG